MDKEQEERVDLVLEEGGVKGTAHVGALSVLEEQSFRTQNVAGTSAGAIVAALHGAGYRAGELLEITRELDYKRFVDKGWEDRIPLVGIPLSILKVQGIYEGNEFLEFMSGLLEEKGVRTFANLIGSADEENPRCRYKVQVIASDITGRQLLVLTKDAVKLGRYLNDLGGVENLNSIEEAFAKIKSIL